MAVLKLTEPYAVTSLRNDVRDSLMMSGEQAVLLQLFHAGDSDAIPCPQCGDDIYKSPEVNCTSCYGTTFLGGAKAALKVWSLFTDQDQDERFAQRGQGLYQTNFRSVQMEAFPMVTEHDVIVRVKTWGSDNTVEELDTPPGSGFFVLQRVLRRSLRTGYRAGQYAYDVVAQKAQISEIPLGAPLTSYPILGQQFAESISLRTTTPPTAVVQPDVKVVAFPFPYEVSAGGLTPVGGNRTYAETVGNGVDTVFVIAHNFGTTDVEVGTFEVSSGEEVTVDITARTINTVTVRFATAPDAGQYRIVIQGGG